MRNQKAFSALELIVVVFIVAVLVSVALPKLYDTILRAEALNAQGTIGTLRSALSLRMASGVYQGEDLSSWVHGGSHAIYPMRDLLSEQPENYLGVCGNSEERGSWYDDKLSHELVYVARNDEIVEGALGSPAKVRWRIAVVYDERYARQKKLIGLALQPSTIHQWKYE